MNRARRLINVQAHEEGLSDGWYGNETNKHRWIKSPHNYVDYMNGFKQGSEARAKKEAKELA